MTRIRLILIASLLALCFNANAQRRVLPLIELVDVPVSLATSKPLSADQVRSAIINGALTTQWDVEQQVDGTLRLSTWRDMEYRITMVASHTSDRYSLRYVSSENLKMSDPFGQNPADSLADYASRWRATKGALAPEYKYATPKGDLVIHTTYELLVYELSASIRRHLKVL